MIPSPPVTNPSGPRARALLAYGGAAAVSVYAAFFLLDYRESAKKAAKKTAKKKR
jgi:hypothetical protein